MKSDLLTSLRKYRPRDGHDPLENFITESFAYVLKNFPDLSRYFLNEIFPEENYLDSDITFNWETQRNFGGKFPDLVCEFTNNSGIVFEHKVDSFLHPEQLSNYLKNSPWPGNTKIVLITRDTSQHDQNPDKAYCWYEIYNIVADWMKDHKNINNGIIIESFLQLLTYEGMGYEAPISHESILYYGHSRDFLKDLEAHMKRILEKLKNLVNEETNNEGFDYNFTIHFHPRSDGRCGIGIFYLEDWLPGIFIGIIYDGKDYGIKLMRDKNSPDFSITLDFHENLHGKYAKNKSYKLLVKELSEKINNEYIDWEFYNHLEDPASQSEEFLNPYHPLHIRKPMIEVYRGTENAKEQDERFMQCAKEILPLILKSQHFKDLRSEYKKH